MYIALDDIMTFIIKKIKNCRQTHITVLQYLKNTFLFIINFNIKTVLL